MPIYKLQGKKNGLQRYRVRVNFTNNKGEYKTIEKVTYGMAEAQDLLSKLQSQYSKNSNFNNTKLTLNNLYQEYRDMKQHEIRATSLNTQDAIFRLRISCFIGCINIQNLSPKQLQQWKNELNNTTLSTITKQKAYVLLKSILEYATKLEYISNNPITKINNFKSPDFVPIQESLHFYTPEQFALFINNAKENRKSYIDYGCFVFFNIAFYTGMRKGEINALKWSDIDGNVIHIRRSIAQKLKGGDVETAPKNKSSYRDIQMPLPLIKIIAEHKELQSKFFKGFNDNFRVCGGDVCLRDTTIERYNKINAEAVGLPHIRVHDYRHSHASLLANNGINVQEIARRLGHSDISMTWNTYSHLYPREEERALEILNNLL